MARHIEIIVRGVCARRGRILLCHTKGKRNTYLPGGHIECGESAEAALRREIQEELGAASRVGRFLGCVEHTFTHKGQRVCEINLVFQLSVEGLSLSDSPRSREAYIEFQWVPLTSLRRAQLEPAVLCRRLPDWIRGVGQAVPWASSYGRSAR